MDVIPWTEKEMEIERKNYRQFIELLQKENSDLKNKLKYYEDRRIKLNLVDMAS